MATVKTNSEMLKSIKSYNKVAREDKAKREGFYSAAALITYLEIEIKAGRGNTWYGKPNSVCPTTTAAPSAKSKPAKPTATPIIHVADVIDSSGSMSGGKHTAAKKGINIGIEGLKSDPEDVNYTYTLCDFSDDIIFRHTKSPLSEVKEFKGNTRGSTALYDAIGDTIEKIKMGIGSTDKVLVNIYTDGQENSSRRYSGQIIAGLIKSLGEIGWTFTFIGTAQDVKYAQNNLHFHESNTLVHDNTERGMASSFATNSVSRTAYSKKVSAGEDVSKGFYKDIN